MSVKKRRGPKSLYHFLRGEFAPDEQRLKRRLFLALMLNAGVDDKEAARRFNLAYAKNISEQQVRQWREQGGPMFSL
jgi:hypothetical protein